MSDQVQPNKIAIPDEDLQDLQQRLQLAKFRSQLESLEQDLGISEYRSAKSSDS